MHGEKKQPKFKFTWCYTFSIHCGKKNPQHEKPMYGSCQCTFVWDTLTRCKDHVCIPSQ